MFKYSILLFLAGCATVEQPKPVVVETLKPMVIKTYNCPPVKMINKTSFIWNKFDEEVLAGATKECPKRFKNSPCVASFYKYNETGHGVACGAENESK